MLRILAIRVASQIATRFRLWRQLESYPFILLSMIVRSTNEFPGRWLLLESSPGKIKQFKMATIEIPPGDDY